MNRHLLPLFLVAVLVLIALAVHVVASVWSPPTAGAASAWVSPLNPPVSERADHALPHPGDRPIGTPPIDKEAAVDADSDAELRRLPPEQAVGIGLGGLAHLYPARTPAESELLHHARVGAWGHAVVACNGYGAREPFGVNESLVRYLVQVRSAGLYIQATDDDQRAGLVKLAVDYLGDSAPALVRAGLFADHLPLLEASLSGLARVSPETFRDPAVYSRLEQLAQHEQPDIASQAAALLAWLRDGGPCPSTITVSMGHGDSWRCRSSGCGFRRVDRTPYTRNDLPALRERYATGTTSDRVAVARIVARYAWPEALDFAVEMLADVEGSVRRYAIEALSTMDLLASHDALVAHYDREPDADNRAHITAGVLAGTRSLAGMKNDMALRALVDVKNAPAAAALDALYNESVPLSGVLTDTIIETVFASDARERSCFTRALQVLWHRGSLADARRAVRTAVPALPDPQMERVIVAIDEAGAPRTDVEVVELLALALARHEDDRRVQVVRCLHKRFGVDAANVLTGCLADTDAVVTEVIDGLAPHRQNRHALALIAHATRSHRAVTDARVLDLAGGRHGHAGMLPAIVHVYESPVAAHRVAAAQICNVIGDIRDLPALLPLLADPDGAVVMAALRPANSLARQQPVDARTAVCRTPSGSVATARFPRVHEREALMTHLIARLLGGDLDVAVWFAKQFPRIEWPDSPEDYCAANLATVVGDYLGIVPGDPLPTDSAPEIIELDSGHVVPRAFYHQLLKHAMKRANAAEPPDFFRRATTGADPDVHVDAEENR